MKFISKRYIKTVDGFKVYTVSGERVKLKHIEFVEGGNGYVYKWIPKNEIWIENVYSKKEQDAILLHELSEVKKMQKGMNYEKAHNIANNIEKKYRIKLFRKK